MEDNFDNLLKTEKREILELKASSMLTPRIRAYTYDFTAHTNIDHHNGHYMIRYYNDDSDILTQAITMADHIFKPPFGNEQEIYIDFHAGTNISVKLVSTRRIERVIDLD